MEKALHMEPAVILTCFEELQVKSIRKQGEIRHKLTHHIKNRRAEI